MQLLGLDPQETESGEGGWSRLPRPPGGPAGRCGRAADGRDRHASAEHYGPENHQPREQDGEAHRQDVGVVPRGRQAAGPGGTVGVCLWCGGTVPVVGHRTCDGAQMDGRCRYTNRGSRTDRCGPVPLGRARGHALHPVHGEDGGQQQQRRPEPCHRDHLPTRRYDGLAGAPERAVGPLVGTLAPMPVRPLLGRISRQGSRAGHPPKPTPTDPRGSDTRALPHADHDRTTARSAPCSDCSAALTAQRGHRTRFEACRGQPQLPPNGRPRAASHGTGLLRFW